VCVCVCVCVCVWTLCVCVYEDVATLQAHSPGKDFLRSGSSNDFAWRKRRVFSDAAFVVMRVVRVFVRACPLKRHAHTHTLTHSDTHL